jgi:LCP family protein required for cell wall assembly
VIRDKPHGRADGSPAAPRRRMTRHAVRVAALMVSGVVLFTGGAGAWVYEHLNGNLRGLPLFGGASGDAGREMPDALGRTPLNVLVIGSDARAGREDCAIGGDCGPARNADVEMIIHLSADRSNATVMSVPRDTVTDLPGCADPETGRTQPPHRGQINSSLGYGPGCTVAAVHALTGIPVDHFMMIDFFGVVRMSDAVGGVPVCVSGAVYDPYSHLRLSAGRHTLRGMGALEYLRSRHAFGDGSDLGRTYAQHLYLAALLRRLKRAGTLTDPAALYGLADAATKALTVDNGLDSVPKLLRIARAMDKVPDSRVTFTTMQNRPDPLDPDRVVVAPAAGVLFRAIIGDRSLTVPGGGRSAVGRELARAASSPQARAAALARAGYAGAPKAPALAGFLLPVPGGGAGAAFDAHLRSAADTTDCARVSPYPTVIVGGRRMTPSQAYAATAEVPASAP